MSGSLFALTSFIEEQPVHDAMSDEWNCELSLQLLIEPRNINLDE